MIEIKTEFCPQNHPCPVVNACPADAIKQNGFGAPEIDEEKCTDCGMCTGFCRTFSKK